MKSNRFVSYDGVKELVLKGQFGWYRLSNITDTKNFAGSNLSSDSSIDYDSKKIVDQLEEILPLLPTNTYKLILKKAESTPTKNEVVYEFFYQNGQDQDEKSLPKEHGLGAYLPIDDVDRRIESAVSRAVALERERFSSELKMVELERKLDELRKEKRKPAEPEWAKGLTDIVKVVGVAILSKVSPESVKTINAMLAQDEGGEDEENTKTSFTRPE